MGMLIRTLGIAQVQLIPDKTLAQRRGKKVPLATMHVDPATQRGEYRSLHDAEAAPCRTVGACALAVV